MTDHRDTAPDLVAELRMAITAARLRREQRETATDHRDAVTGRYVTAEYAETHPDTTVSESREVQP